MGSIVNSGPLRCAAKAAQLWYDSQDEAQTCADEAKRNHEQY